MTDGEAWRWLAVGLVLALGGLLLCHQATLFVPLMWGTGLVVVGGATALVAAGVLLRLWR